MQTSVQFEILNPMKSVTPSAEVTLRIPYSEEKCMDRTYIFILGEADSLMFKSGGHLDSHLSSAIYEVFDFGQITVPV